MMGAYNIQLALIATIGQAVPTALAEVIVLRRTLTRRAGDALTFVGRPGTSNGPIPAIDGRLGQCVVI